MKKRISLVIVTLTIITQTIYGQSGKISGSITDYTTGETLIGVNVIYANGKGTVTDIDGNYQLSLSPGTYTLRFSYVGYEPIEKEVIITDKAQTLDIKMRTIMLQEVEVVADVAKVRETPIAFSTVLPAKIEEQLASQDIPMILNTTPGIYATQEGGGDGDAQVTIRGFDSRNVGVLLDGIPVNDMETGHVYWSNWFGLDLVTRSIQVQRGLGASKLALPSVGGTINIVTKGIQNKEEVKVKQEIDSELKSRTSASYNSGRMANGWGFTIAGSYKTGDGWVDETWSRAGFYYAKIEKMIGNHIISATAMGAPQKHAQRKYRKDIATFDKEYAKELGIDTFHSQKNVLDKGLRYNPHWGYLTRYQQEEEVLHEAVNIYHKPMFTLRHFWNVHKKMYLSNIVYYSYGNGGGTTMLNSLGAANYDENGQINWQNIYNGNQQQYDYDLGGYLSGQAIMLMVNKHHWLGYLSTVDYKISNMFEFSGGVDLRTYRGEHYKEVYDLLGGDFLLSNNTNVNRKSGTPLTEGDKEDYHNDGIVRYGGFFSQLEFKSGRWSSFVNLTGAYNGYQRIDYFKYTPENQESEWVWVPGYTIKGGVNYNLTERMSLYSNAGHLNKARGHNYVFRGYSNDIVDDIKNEEINSLELGYRYASPAFTMNINAYNTNWQNKPTGSISSVNPEGDDIIAYPDGMNALHKGIEMDFIYKVTKFLDIEGLLSIGDWVWDTKIEDMQYYNRQTQALDINRDFNIQGVHVGNSAQTQYGGSIRIEPIKRFYIKPVFIYFDNYYADFDPVVMDGSAKTLDENGDPIDSWKIPEYYLLDLHAGYRFDINDLRFNVRASLLNAMDLKYIATAKTNDTYLWLPFTTFDAKSSSVFFGLGRRINTSLTLTF